MLPARPQRYINVTLPCQTSVGWCIIYKTAIILGMKMGEGYK
jgi:hypothetical protein